MTCSITSYHLNLNSSHYPDSCYVTRLGTSFCVDTQVTVNTHTKFRMDVNCRMVPGFAHLEVAFAKACHEPFDISTVSIVLAIQMYAVHCDQASYCTRHYSNLTCKWLIGALSLQQLQRNSDVF